MLLLSFEVFELEYSSESELDSDSTSVNSDLYTTIIKGSCFLLDLFYLFLLVLFPLVFVIDVDLLFRVLAEGSFAPTMHRLFVIDLSTDLFLDTSAFL